jgi:hypothetical protein
MPRFICWPQGLNPSNFVCHPPSLTHRGDDQGRRSYPLIPSRSARHVLMSDDT